MCKPRLDPALCFTLKVGSTVLAKQTLRKYYEDILSHPQNDWISFLFISKESVALIANKYLTLVRDTSQVTLFSQ